MENEEGKKGGGGGILNSALIWFGGDFGGAHVILARPVGKTMGEEREA